MELLGSSHIAHEFPASLVILIMCYVQTISFSILTNNSLTTCFNPIHDIQQCDSHSPSLFLSLYFFIIYIKNLSFKIRPTERQSIFSSLCFILLAYLFLTYSLHIALLCYIGSAHHKQKLSKAFSRSVPPNLGHKVNY